MDLVRTEEILIACLDDDGVLLQGGQLEQALPQEIHAAEITHDHSPAEAGDYAAEAAALHARLWNCARQQFADTW